MTVDLHNRVAIVTGAERTEKQVPASGFEQYRYEVEQARTAAAGKGG